MGPLRYQLYRQVRLRATTLGWTPPLHEDELLQAQPVRPAAV